MIFFDQSVLNGRLSQPLAKKRPLGSVNSRARRANKVIQDKRNDDILKKGIVHG
ncbi:hypothetical protein STRDD11_01695 [Streptococcus sp. DD11]|nr:hypothetical protein STRDD11_01695 [Streptococcus sp. DD11]